MISVLYVDDEESLLELGKVFLESMGPFTVDITPSTNDAIDKLKSTQYDAVISDYQMPETDGISFLKRIRSQFGDIPFILFTGRGREEVVIQAINNGADSYMQKGGDANALFTELGHKIKSAVDRKLTAVALRDSEQKLSDIINFLPDPTFAIDTRGTVITWNRAMEEVTGVSAADMLNRANYEYSLPIYGVRRKVLIDLILENDEAVAHGEYAIIKREGNILIAETSSARPRGIPRTFLCRASLLYNEAGTITGAIETLRDITAQKMTEANLESSRDYLSKIFSSVKAGILVIDAGSHEILDINEAGSDLIGLPKGEITGRVCHTFVCPSDAKKCPVTDLGQPVDNSERILITSAGRQVPIIKFATRVIVNGRDCILETFIDNTQRKLDEEELRAAYEQLAATEEELRTQYEELRHNQQVITKSEEKFRAILNQSFEFIGLMTTDGTLIDANQSALAFAGIAKADILNRPFWETPWWTHSAWMQEMLKDAVNRAALGETVRFEATHPDAGGHIAIVDFSIKPVRDDEGKVLYLIPEGRDITKRKRAEEELRAAYEQLAATEETLRSQYDELKQKEEEIRLACRKASDAEEELRFLQVAVDKAHEVVFRLDLTGKILYANEAAERKTGYPRNELLSMNFFDLDPDTGSDTAEERIREIRLKENAVFLARHRSRDGLVIDVEVMVSYVKRGDRELCFAFIHDVTECRRTEVTLKELEEKFQTIVDYAFEGILIVDPRGTIISANHAALRIVEETDIATLQGKNILDFLTPGSRETASRDFGVVLLGHDTYVAEYTILTRSGRSISIECIGKRLENAGMDAVLVSIHDITRYKAAEEALLQANRKFKLLNRITRHDINNKVTSILGYLVLARTMFQDEKLAALFDKLETLANAIGDQIRFTKTYQLLGTTEPFWQEVSRILPRSPEPSRLSLAVEVDGISVYGDPILEKVFANLLDNTYRHGEHATAIRVYSRETPDGLSIFWEDDGVGIAAGEKEKIFDQGYGKNTGLGLFLTREILSITGMTIRECGEPGKGARFEILVPKGVYRVSSTPHPAPSGPGG